MLVVWRMYGDARSSQQLAISICFLFVPLQIFDTAQFVVLSGQLSGSGAPWVVKYFIEYFTPLTGLVPVAGNDFVPSLGSDSGHWNATSAPQAITGLLQGGYWKDMTPARLFTYSWCVDAGLVVDDGWPSSCPCL